MKNSVEGVIEDAGQQKFEGQKFNLKIATPSVSMSSSTA